MRSICVTERILQHTYHSLLLGLIKLEPGTNNRTKGNCEAAIWTALRRFHSRLSSIPPSAAFNYAKGERESKHLEVMLRFVSGSGSLMLRACRPKQNEETMVGRRHNAEKKYKNTGRDKRGLERVKRRVSASEGSLADNKHQIACKANYISLTCEESVFHNQ